MFSIPNKREYSFTELKQVLAEYQYVFKSGLQLLCLWYPEIKHTYVKLPLGKHIWYDAEIIDMTSKRQGALAEKQSYAKVENPYLKGFLNGLFQLKDPYTRLNYMYRYLKPYYLKRLEDHLLFTDAELDYGTYTTLNLSVIYLKKQIKESFPVLEALEEESTIDSEINLISKLNLLWLAYQKSQLDETYEDSSLINILDELNELKMPQMIVKPERDVPIVQPMKKDLLDNTKIDLSNNDFKIAYLYGNGYLELQASEIIASMIYEYFDLNWKMIHNLSRQLYDECRHALLCFNRMEELGGDLGQYTTSLLQWEYVHKGNNIIEKFIIQHRLSEGTGTDASLNNVVRFRDMGDEKTAKMYEFIGADEIQHVKMGNFWIEYFLPDLAERKKIIKETQDKIVSYLEKEGLPIDFLSCVPVALDHRELAGFKVEEINEIVQERDERCS
ncbi:DUF455 family protein [Bacillus wiedmannii]|uniref:DUF455 family protein n=1 Tax=Bacillus wiedmannii TaxID=1890302 RepID=UPI003F917144